MVDILMATYNGAKYIETQILSIISQSYNNWNLIVHDDGSIDDTLAITKKWAQIDNRIKIIDDGIHCGGAAQNFIHLLKYSEAEYVMFCDQDDMWFDNKVEIMYHTISNMSKDRPCVVYSNSYVWHPDKGIKGTVPIKMALCLQELLFMNGGIQGCMSIFDANTRDYLLRYSGCLSMHDHLLHLIAVSFGKVSFVHTPLMLYRKHGKNVTGETKTKILDDSLIVKNKRIPLVDNLHYETIKRFRCIYSSDLSKKDKKIIDIFLALPNKSYISRLYYILFNQYKLYNSISLLVVKSLIRPFKS